LSPKFIIDYSSRTLYNGGERMGLEGREGVGRTEEK
jgi:hypothetical protein